MTTKIRSRDYLKIEGKSQNFESHNFFFFLFNTITGEQNISKLMAIILYFRLKKFKIMF